MSAPTPLDDAYDLPDACVQEYRERGHTLVRGLATPDEVARFRPGIVEAAEAARHDHRPLAERDTYGRAFLQMLNLWPRHDVARAFVTSRRFARVAAGLLGVPAVRLYHDQALFKEPGGGLTPWHQDQFYWPLETDHTITLWMPLVDVTPDMGPMAFASGSHRRGSLGDYAIGDESEEALQRVVDERRWPVTDYGALAAGDATFHSGWTLHRAPGNASASMREVMTVIYYPDGTRVGPLDHPNRRFDRDAWLRGCEPGDLAAGRRNPVLYDRAQEAS